MSDEHLEFEKPAFVPTKSEEERAKETSTVYTVRLNREEEALILSAGSFVQQPKLSTLIKQLALLNARRVLQDRETQELLLVAVNNVRRNMETGVPFDMPSDRKILGNVIQNPEEM